MTSVKGRHTGRVRFMTLSASLRIGVMCSSLLSCVSGTRFSMLDWVRVTGLSCTKGVWYIYDRDTGQLIRCMEGPYGLPLLPEDALLSSM